HVRVRGRGIQVEVALLAIFAVIALGTREPEQPFFQYAIAAVPQRQCETQPALAIANPEKSILAPAIGATAGMLVRKIAPGIAVGGVVFADRAPLPLGEIRPPAFPVRRARVVLGETTHLRVVDLSPIVEWLLSCHELILAAA